MIFDRRSYISYPLHFVFVLIAFFNIECLNGQNYFQQQVDYKLNVSLDVSIDVTASEDIMLVDGYFDYTNNSSDTISFLYMHQWWNAFSDKTSAFGMQQYALGEYAFHFADADELGGYKDMVYRQEEVLSVEPYEDGGRAQPDIVKVQLSEAIAPGTQTRVYFNYRLKVPQTFSRPEKDEELFRMTQWYPKPAVYDQDGWHPMPYLSIGEFYAEYGNYEVTIDLPQDYKIVGTGVGSRDNTSTFVAKNVLDFAWFASLDFDLTEKVINVDGRDLTLNLFTDFESGHEELLGYMEDAIRFYSTEVGPYVYPQYTLVLNDGEGRGGMEYPMVSMVDHSHIDQNLDNLIAHEIGHNWFQSMLGSNERNYPWMDEGLNSFYERAYNDSKYEEANFESMIPAFLKGKGQEMTIMEGGVAHLYCCGKLGAIDQCSQDMDPVTYVSNSYQRMAWSLQYLESYLGDSFSRGMKKYFTNWQNKHPQPSDFRAVMEAESGKELGWFFEDILKQNKPFDYKIETVEASCDLLNVTIKNKSQFDIPISLDCYDEDGKLVYSEWVELLYQDEAIPVPNENYSRITINGETPFLDVDRKNNHYHVGKIFPHKPRLSFGLLGQHGDSKSKLISLMPAVTYNTYDGAMLGGILYNDFYPYNNTRWVIQPTFGFNAKELVGRFAIEHDLIRKNDGSPRWTLGLQGRRYNYKSIQDVAMEEDTPQDYYKIQPSLAIHFNKGLMKDVSLSYNLHYINKEFYDFFEFDYFRESNLIHQVNFKSGKPTRLGRSDLLAQLEYESYSHALLSTEESYLKLSLDYKRSLHYKEDARFFFRFFGSYFPLNSQRESSSFSSVFSQGSIALSQQGFTDHTFENYFMGRTDQSGLLSRQFVEEEGGFKIPLGSAYNTGMSNDYLLSVNMKSDLPFDIMNSLNLRPFLDAAVVSRKSTSGSDLSAQFLYAAGLSFEIGDAFGIYFPIVYSDVFSPALSSRSLFSKISFKLDINKLNLWRLVEKPGTLIKS